MAAMLAELRSTDVHPPLYHLVLWASERLLILLAVVAAWAQVVVVRDEKWTGWLVAGVASAGLAATQWFGLLPVSYAHRSAGLKFPSVAGTDATATGGGIWPPSERSWYLGRSGATCSSCDTPPASPPSSCSSWPGRGRPWPAAGEPSWPWAPPLVSALGLGLVDQQLNGANPLALRLQGGTGPGEGQRSRRLGDGRLPAALLDHETRWWRGAFIWRRAVGGSAGAGRDRQPELLVAGRLLYPGPGLVERPALPL
ncbi:MAG: hypothetical protein ACRD0Q_00055 [Acidimicrobiales bacterium]